MNEDEIMALIGRLYVSAALRDKELVRVKALLEGYEQTAREARFTYEEDHASPVVFAPTEETA